MKRVLVSPEALFKTCQRKGGASGVKSKQVKALSHKRDRRLTQLEIEEMSKCLAEIWYLVCAYQYSLFRAILIEKLQLRQK